jgi:hypothetical protein
MIQRCTNPNSAKSYARYGGRGITVCERWLKSFEAFLADMGPRPSPQHSIEREKNERGYDPDNCVWATRNQQARNKRNNKRYRVGTEELTLAEWSERNGIHRATMLSRIRSGWDPALAITTPLLHYHGSGRPKGGAV